MDMLSKDISWMSGPLFLEQALNVERIAGGGRLVGSGLRHVFVALMRHCIVSYSISLGSPLLAEELSAFRLRFSVSAATP
jgi:hypothetical protein